MGLTGPTGSGKSTVAQILAENGFWTVDADRAARIVVEPGSACLCELTRAFGDILHEDGSLNRKKLAAAAFADRAGVEKLNSVTHPHILKEIQSQLEGLRAAGCEKALLDAPALFESGAERLCTKVAVVVAPEDVRLARILVRDGISPQEASRRMKAQPPVTFYTGRADYIFENNGGKAELTEAAQKLARAVEESIRGRQGGAP